MAQKTWMDRRRERLAREAADAARLADAVEAEAEQEMKRTITPKLTKAGHACPPKSPVAQAEADRVKEILRRDREAYGVEIARAAAEIEFDKGKKVSIVDIAIEPTEEWKEKGPFETFTPRLEDGTVKTVKAHRRIVGSVVKSLFMRGKLKEDHCHACLWYAAQWEISGQMGRVKTNHLSLTGNVGGGGGAGQAPMALHATEAEARQAYRAARDAIPPHLLKMFEAVTLENLSLNRASRFVRCRNGNALPRFLAACVALVAHLERTKTEFAPSEDRG